VVSEVLQLAQLVELHGVAEVQVGPRRVEALLDPQRLAAGELGDELGLDEQFVGSALEHGEMVRYVDGHGGFGSPASPAVPAAPAAWGDERPKSRGAGFGRIAAPQVSPLAMAAHKIRILTQSMPRTLARALGAWSGGQWLAVAVLGLSGVAAFGLAPDTTLETVPLQTIVRELPNPAIAALEAPEAAASAERYWREERVRRGDTIGSVLARLAVDDPEATAFLRTDPAARPLYQLRPGKPLRVEIDTAGRLESLRFVAGSGELLSIDRHDGGFTAASGAAPVDVRWEMASGEIASSLFAAADANNVPDAITLQLTEVFGGEIDFYHDLRRGDRFSVVYEMRYLDGEPVGPGRIVAAEFDHLGKVTRAYRWRDAAGVESYFTEDGAALRKAFLRSPMEFTRVSSGFSNARFHPILQTWRAHKGIDYPAPSGTPVRATANGRVVVAGAQNGYGNVVRIEHRGVFSTLYAHLSRIAPQVRAGARVVQGDVIGYVGQTGWATGPHLHYEFRVANEPRDPLTVALPNGEPLPPAGRPAFAAGTAPAAAQLMLARSFAGSPLASAE
jgi:murein DD-endopeptidase MepM/ murein hydrolase activator NlpD